MSVVICLAGRDIAKFCDPRTSVPLGVSTCETNKTCHCQNKKLPFTSCCNNQDHGCRYDLTVWYSTCLSTILLLLSSMPSFVVVPTDVSLVQTTTWRNSPEVVCELDSRCHRDGQKSHGYSKRSFGGICRGLRRHLQTEGVYCGDISLELEQVTHVKPSIHPQSSLKKW